MLDQTEKHIDAGGLPLWNAVLCLDCEIITDRRSDECPLCHGRSLVSLARILGGSLFAHRQRHSPESENALFDITATVELHQMHPKDLTATLERLTNVIGPKLAREQAGFHIDVKPPPDRFKSQGFLCFPERDAA